jgi:DNA processing protein
MEDYIEININDEIYPSKLKNIKNIPKKLFLRGKLELIQSNSIAIVGSRECTSYGFYKAYEFAKELSKKGICVISGLAQGIDTAAHLGAMHQKGKTIAVLGTGLNKIYPKENEILAESILKNGGLIISEYGLYEERKSENFPKRNRIMSGLSDGILVIEARRKSGTLITARYAKEQGKKVFSLPGNVDIINSSGTNELIKNGAILVTNVKDILDEFTIQKEEENKEEVNQEYKKVYDVLEAFPMHINEICKKTNSSMAEVNQIITMLEIEGLIKSLPNNEFVKG